MLTTVQWIAMHSRIYGQHILDLIYCFKLELKYNHIILLQLVLLRPITTSKRKSFLETYRSEGKAMIIMWEHSSRWTGMTLKPYLRHCFFIAGRMEEKANWKTSKPPLWTHLHNQGHSFIFLKFKSLGTSELYSLSNHYTPLPFPLFNLCHTPFCTL